MAPPRPCVVVLAFACEPGAGSEEGVGWAWTVAAAQIADVTLVTGSDAADQVRAASDALGLRLGVIEVDVAPMIRRLLPRKLVFVRYLLWQGLAARVVRRCERDGTVDVVHHLTWGSDSLPSALLASRAPVRIWGPVGGSTTTARGLYRYLSGRGRVDQVFRDVVNAGLRRAFGARVARHATLVATLNQDGADRFGPLGTAVVVEPHVALPVDEVEPGPVSAVPDLPFGTPSSGRTALFVGRLIPWKGLLLAVQALVHAPEWRLLVLGSGPEREPAEALAERLGVSDRIEFVGRVPRADVLAAFRTVDALVHPSFHDSAPWAVGEASAAGCPVVCLDVGGTALVAGPNGHVVPVGSGAGLPQRFAASLNALHGRGHPDDRWHADRLPALLHEWYGVTPEPPSSAHADALVTSVDDPDLCEPEAVL